VRFLLLGPVAVVARDGRRLTLRRRQERGLLALLLLKPGHAVSIDHLCYLLWDEYPPAQARRTIHTYVARIRALLTQAGAERDGVELVSTHGGYQLLVPAAQVDANEFRDLLARAGEEREPSDRLRLLQQALSLWRGPALADAASDRLRELQCADLEELHFHAIEEALAAHLDLGRHREVLPELARRCAEYPDRQRLTQLHMLALQRAGRTREALDVYTAARRRLADRFGLDPSPALQRLHQAVLRGDPALDIGDNQPRPPVPHQAPSPTDPPVHAVQPPGEPKQPGHLPIDRQIVALRQTLSSNELLLEIMRRISRLKLPNWYVVAGGIVQTVWNVLTGRPVGAGIRDYDVIYHDPRDLSRAAEDDVISRAALLFSDLDAVVEVGNQARVHLWYEQRFGVPCAPYPCTEAAIDTFPAQTTCVGVHLDGAEWKVYAPYGLSDMFNLVVRPNPILAPAAVYADKTRRWQRIWPELTVLPWPTGRHSRRGSQGSGRREP
jgi:DNA-binding SARP family transcriptional activator